MEGLAQNRARILGLIDDACAAFGRDRDEVQLVCVTKKVEPEVAAALVRLGSTELGENRLPELERKRAWFDAHGLTARWHFIGHIQRNKARRTLALSDEIHSVDSARLLTALARAAEELDHHPPIFLQVQSEGDENKSGFRPDEVHAALDLASASGALPVRGLMTMAPLVADREDASAAALSAFSALATLADSLPGDAFVGSMPRLSMGMTGDFREALRAGAHVLRIGSALYKESGDGCDRPSDAGSEGDRV